MDTQELNSLLALAKKTALAAGEAILTVYASADFQTEHKADDSPLTLADRKAHEIIAQELAESKRPLLSEEGSHFSYEERSQWPIYWLVDPLDGTKEFVKKNGEFTVNIALVEGRFPVMGVVYQPVSRTLYWGSPAGAFEQVDGGEVKAISVAAFSESDPGLGVVASRSHLDAHTQAFIEKLNAPKLKSMGSSLKFMLVAKGEAHIYPRMAPTMEWDTAAAQAVVEAAGGTINRIDTGERFYYSKPDLLNTFFVCKGNVVG